MINLSRVNQRSRPSFYACITDFKNKGTGSKTKSDHKTRFLRYVHCIPSPRWGCLFLLANTHAKKATSWITWWLSQQIASAEGLCRLLTKRWPLLETTGIAHLIREGFFYHCVHKRAIWYMYGESKPSIASQRCIGRLTLGCCFFWHSVPKFKALPYKTADRR